MPPSLELTAFVLGCPALELALLPCMAQYRATPRWSRPLFFDCPLVGASLSALDGAPSMGLTVMFRLPLVGASSDVLQDDRSSGLAVAFGLAYIFVAGGMFKTPFLGHSLK